MYPKNVLYVRMFAKYILEILITNVQMCRNDDDVELLYQVFSSRLTKTGTMFSNRQNKILVISLDIQINYLR